MPPTIFLTLYSFFWHFKTVFLFSTAVTDYFLKFIHFSFFICWYGVCMMQSFLPERLGNNTIWHLPESILRDNRHQRLTWIEVMLWNVWEKLILKSLEYFIGWCTYNRHLSLGHLIQMTRIIRTLNLNNT